MPTYMYQCAECKHYFELFLPMKNLMKPTKKPCPQCGLKKVENLIGSPAIVSGRGMGKPSHNFTDRLKEIKSKHRGSNINTFGR